MMPWTNAFDTGPCTVQVIGINGGPGIIFNQVMSKGDSGTLLDGDYHLTVAVDDSGAITLTDTDASIGTLPEYLVLSVEPVADITGLDVRISSLYCANAEASARSSAGDTSLTVGGDGSCTPDPVEWDGIGSYVAMFGINGV